MHYSHVKSVEYPYQNTRLDFEERAEAAELGILSGTDLNCGRAYPALVEAVGQEIHIDFYWFDQEPPVEGLNPDTLMRREDPPCSFLTRMPSGT